MAKARSAASGLANTYVELRNTAGRADPTDRLGSKPRVSTAVRGCRAPPCGSSCSDIRTPAPSVAPGSSTGTPAFFISDYGIPNYLDAGSRGATTKSLSTGVLEGGSEQIPIGPAFHRTPPNAVDPRSVRVFFRIPPAGPRPWRHTARPRSWFDATISQPQFTIDRSTPPLSSPNWSSALPVVAPVSYDVIWRNTRSERSRTSGSLMATETLSRTGSGSP